MSTASSNHSEPRGKMLSLTGKGNEVMPGKKYSKAPNAPKRFKSSFIFYTMERHHTIRKQLGDDKVGETSSGDVIKKVRSFFNSMRYI